MRLKALTYLYARLKWTRQSLSYAQSNPDTAREELDRLQQHLDVLEWLIAAALAASESDAEEG